MTLSSIRRSFLTLGLNGVEPSFSHGANVDQWHGKDRRSTIPRSPWDPEFSLPPHSKICELGFVPSERSTLFSPSNQKSLDDEFTMESLPLAYQPLRQSTISSISTRMGTSGPMRTSRRQNRSCDQCRKGKRACDAWIGDEEDDLDISSYSSLGPCTNCTKTNKNCTFFWRISHEPNTATRQIKDENKRRKTNTDSTVFSIPIISQSEPLEMFHDVPNPNLYDFIPGDSYIQTQSNQIIPTGQPSSFMWDGPIRKLAVYSGQKRPLSPNLLLVDDEGTIEDQQQQQKDYDKLHFLLTHSSPHSMQQRLTESINKEFINKGLMKIYHDSMENALSCWLNERTCPYSQKALITTDNRGDELRREWGDNWSNRVFGKVLKLDRAAAGIRDRLLTKLEEAKVTRAFSLVIMSFATQWAQSSRRSRTQLNPRENNQRLWEMGDPTVDPTTNPTVDYAAELPTYPNTSEFDRGIQESVWKQARQALQDCAEIESYRIVFAQIIFSLTQRSFDVDEFNQRRRSEDVVFESTDHISSSSNSPEASTSSVEPETPTDFSQIQTEVERVIEHDGPPIYLEQGLRNIHSIRHQLERQERRIEKAGGSPNTSTTILSKDDRQTVELIYWLGVMFDTLSASMHNRPLVVSDEDSDVLPESIEYLESKGLPREKKLNSGASNLWTDFFFLQEQSQRSNKPLRWPCSHEAAAAGLCDAAPIKVLLYRKVALLQTLFSKCAHSEKMETAIKDSMMVYRHWNVTYGPFIRDCITNHDDLPARVQSWYICLTGHWHLATLLLADIIESIDEAELGDESRMKLRKDSNFVSELRTYNSHLVSDLARCSTPRNDASFPDSAQFHFAVKEGALLTEPWTVILIRVFSKSAVLLMEQASNSPRTDIDQVWLSEQLSRRCEDCIRALWYLGKKSDMARVVAETLRATVKKLPNSNLSVETTLGQNLPEWSDWSRLDNVADEVVFGTWPGGNDEFDSFLSQS